MQEWDHLLGLDPPSSTRSKVYLLSIPLPKESPVRPCHPLHDACFQSPDTKAPPPPSLPQHIVGAAEKRKKHTHPTHHKSTIRTQALLFTPDSIQPELQRSHQMSIQYSWLRLKLQVPKTQVIQFFSWSKPAITSKLRAEREGKQKKPLPRQFFTTYTTEDFWSRQIPTYSRNLAPKRIEQSTKGTWPQRPSADIWGKGKSST